jgi:hypothetical protein
MADQLVTPSELASFLQQDLDTASATLAIEMATGKVQGAAGQRLVAATSTFVIDVGMCDDDQYLMLPQWPVRSVTSVLIDGVADTAWKLRSQQLWRLAGWNTNASAPTQVTAVVVHGYLAGAQGLQLARDYTFSLAGAGYDPNLAAGVTSEAIDDYKVTYAEADARMQVTPYMRDQLRETYGIPAYVTSSR